MTIAEQAEQVQWPTPAARDYKGANGAEHLEAGTGRKHLDQLPNFVEHLWATPRAEDSEQCGNHPGVKGGDSLTGQCRSFPLLRETSPDGDASSNSDPTSPLPLWKTPHGFANTDVHGKTGGGGGEFHKQAMRVGETLWPTPVGAMPGSSQNGINGKGGEHERPSANTPGLGKMSKTVTEETWSTPRTNCNIQNKKNLPPPSEGGRSSKPGLEDQAKTMQGPKAKLNPQFVEWLMNLPVGWTGFAPVGTEYFHWRQRTRSLLYALARSLRTE